MKIYEVTQGKYQKDGSNPYGRGEEWPSYLGNDFEEAKKALVEELSSGSDKDYYIEGRIYEIEDGVDVDDKDELADAICDCCGFDTFYSDFRG